MDPWIYKCCFPHQQHSSVLLLSSDIITSILYIKNQYLPVLIILRLSLDKNEDVG